MYVVHELHSGDRDSVSLGEALEDLQRLTERLRRDCPWDREQTARTIVPHTVEEAYEVADAAVARDDAKLADELGDLLFQVYFLSLLLEERGVGDLAEVARGVHAKLVRRHPHVFGEVEAETARRVRSNWEAIKRDQEIGIWQGPRGNAYLARSLYAPQLEKVSQLFPREQVFIIKYENFRTDPFPLLDRMFDFLGVPRKSRLKNKQRNVGSYSRKLTSEEREYAGGIFDEDIAKIEALLGWDCPDWRFKTPVSARA